MVAGEYIEKHGRFGALVTIAMLGITWIMGFWHNLSELNFGLILLFFSIVVAVSAFLKWIFRLIFSVGKSDTN